MDWLDFYGTSYQLNVFGKSSYKTTFSFISSFATITLIGISTWLIGKDFIFNLNPKVINSTVMPEVSEPVYVNNRNFTFAFRLENEDEEIITDDKAFAFPHLYYEIHKRTENGVMESFFEKMYHPVPCLQTEAKDNPLIQKFDPETLSCFDMEQIKHDLGIEQDIDLYGGFEEDYVSDFSLVYSNCKYIDDEEPDLSTCVSYEEAVKRNTEPQYLSIYLPKVTFSPEDYEEPLKTYYDNIYFTVSPYTDLAYELKYSLFTLEDDKGWIFEDIHKTIMADLADEQKEFRFLTKEAFDTNKANTVNIELSFQRKQVKVKRVFVKIQELAANLGGIMKLVFLVFSMMNKLYSTFKIEATLIEKYLSQSQSTQQGNNSSLAAVKVKTKPIKLKITFTEYLAMKLNCTKKIKDKKNAVSRLRSKLDVEDMIKVFAAEQEKIEKTNSEMSRIQFKRPNKKLNLER